jgi:hypothetical protein
MSAIHPLNRAPRQHTGHEYLGMPMNVAAEELFTGRFTPRSLAWELAGEIRWRESHEAADAFWTEYTQEPDLTPWFFRKALVNALAELGVTEHLMNWRRS